MTNNESLQDWINDALSSLGGEGTIIDIAKYIWTHHERDLREKDDLFFTWQYQMRWAAQHMQKDKKLLKTKSGNKAIWKLIRN